MRKVGIGGTGNFKNKNAVKLETLGVFFILENLLRFKKLIEYY